MSDQPTAPAAAAPESVVEAQKTVRLKNEERVSRAVAEKARVKAERKKTSAKPKDRSMSDVPAAARRRALVVYLRKAGATAAMAAKPVPTIAAKLGYGDYDVYCLAYHKFKLAKEGYVKTVSLDGERSLCVYLTKKGQTVDLDSIG